MSNFASLVALSLLALFLHRAHLRGDVGRIVARALSRRRRYVLGECQRSAYYWNTQIELVILDPDGRAAEIRAVLGRSRRVAVSIDAVKPDMDHVHREPGNQGRTRRIAELVERAIRSVNDILLHGHFIVRVCAVMQRRVTRARSGGVSQRVMRVQQTAEFNDADDDREE